MSKINISRYAPEYDVTPQAIFWRTLKYFTIVMRDGEDGLDEYRAASFSINNDTRFDLRTYAGHPDFTVTLYLPADVKDKAEISRVIKIVIKEMVIPNSAVAWRRGDPFTYGELKRPKNDRFRESEARILALKIAAQQPNRTATTTFIKNEVPKYFQLSPSDLVKSTTRPREKMWQQIVRNVTSRDGLPSGLFGSGYALRVAGGLSVTDKGMDYLKSLGFVDSFEVLAE